MAEEVKPQKKWQRIPRIRLNVYCDNESPPFPVQARDIYLTAEATLEAADTLALIQSRRFGLPDGKHSYYAPSTNEVYECVPAMALQAFSLELYFKSITFLDTKKVIRGHNLLVLFNGLNSTRQIAIESRYNKLVSGALLAELKQRYPQLDTSLRGVLTVSAEAFDKMRYIYEEPMKAGTGFVAHTVIDVMRKYVPEVLPPEHPPDNAAHSDKADHPQPT